MSDPNEIRPPVKAFGNDLQALYDELDHFCELILARTEDNSITVGQLDTLRRWLLSAKINIQAANQLLKGEQN